MSSRLLTALVNFAHEVAKEGVQVYSVTVNKVAYDDLLAGITLPDAQKTQAAQDAEFTITHSGGKIIIRWEQ